MKIEIKEVSSKDILPIRQKVLRKGKPLEFCKMEGDNLKTSIHLGLFYDNELAGIATLMLQNNLEFTSDAQLRLRGMAVLPEFQKKQLGKLLIEKAISSAKEKNYDLLWFNAREEALGFYKKFGFSVKGNQFMINDVGFHYLMYKKL